MKHVYEYHHLQILFPIRKPIYYLEKMYELGANDVYYIPGDRFTDVYVKTRNLAFYTVFKETFTRTVVYKQRIQKYNWKSIKH